jgi:pimeloyl-ACP methyl ester carboxylesterase
MSEPIPVAHGELWVEIRGEGPDVLFIAGLGDPAETWAAQLEGLADRYRLFAFDNRGAGRSPLTDAPLSVASMAEDAVSVLDRRGVSSAHVVGHSGGSIVAQELALRRPDLVSSLVLVGTWARPDAYFRSVVASWRWMAAAAPNPEALLKAFFLWLYTPAAHADGTVERAVSNALSFPHPQTPEGFQAQIDAFSDYHYALDRFAGIAAPTLVLAGELDIATPPRLGRLVAEQLPNAEFETIPAQAHRPFEETPNEFNARLDAFWRDAASRAR